jgi:hypothetical protein
MKTFVVLAGLMVIVPRVDPRGQWRELTVLVLNVDAANRPADEPPHHHVTTVTNLGGKFHRPHLEGDWILKSNAVGRPMELVGDERYLVLERIYGSQSALPPMRPECHTGKVIAGCIDADQNPLVRAVLTFKGGWRIRPVEITHDREPRALVYDDSTWGFMALPSNKLLPQSSPPEVQLSAGLILEPLDDTVPEIMENKVSIGSLEALPRPEVCALFTGYAGNCAVLRFLNVMHAISSQGEAQPNVDFTQDVIYELFTKEPPVRYVTELRKDARPEVMDLLYPGGGGSPFPRPCPPPTFAPAVQVTK